MLGLQTALHYNFHVTLKKPTVFMIVCCIDQFIIDLWINWLVYLVTKYINWFIC